MPLPVDADVVRNALITIVNVSVARTLDDAASVLGRAVTAADVEPVTLSMSERGRAVDARAYARAIATTHQIGLAMARFHERYDVVLSPTLAKPPVPLGVLSLSAPDPKAMARALAGVWSLHGALQRDGTAIDVGAAPLDAGRAARRRDVLRPLWRRGHALPACGATRGGAALGASSAAL